MNELTEEKMSVPNPFRNLTESQWKKNYNDYVSYLVTKELVIGLGYTKETNSWTVMKRRVHWFNSTIATGYEDIREKSFHSYKEALEETRRQVKFLIELYKTNSDKLTVDYSML